MTIVRAPRPEGNFYVLDKAISEDDRLSWAARGLLVYLLGKPDHWRVSRQALVPETARSLKPSRRDGVSSLLGELIASGYCTRVQPRLADGRLGPVEYQIHEAPGADVPAAPLPTPADQAATPAKKEKTKPLPAAALAFDSTTGLFSKLPAQVLARWGEAFPQVNVASEIVRAGSWLLANPQHDKKNYQRYLNNWLSRTQDRAASDARQASRPGATPGRPMSRAARIQADGAILTGIAPEAYQGQASATRWTDWPDVINITTKVVPESGSQP